MRLAPPGSLLEATADVREGLSQWLGQGEWVGCVLVCVSLCVCTRAWEAKQELGKELGFLIYSLQSSLTGCTQPAGLGHQQLKVTQSGPLCCGKLAVVLAC